MTDIELTRACAQAMGYDISEETDFIMAALSIAEMKAAAHPFPIERTMYSWFRYDPLHDDAQAMALVKKFVLHITHSPQKGGWLATHWHLPAAKSRNSDLSRAIVQCLAAMHAARK